MAVATAAVAAVAPVAGAALAVAGAVAGLMSLADLVSNWHCRSAQQNLNALAGMLGRGAGGRGALRLGSGRGNTGGNRGGPKGPNGKANEADANAARTRCFVAGTLIQTANGLVPIENILVGDLVASKDSLTGEVTWKPVVQLFVNTDKTIINLNIEGDDGSSEQIGTTGEHPFWVENGGWVEVADLRVGDRVAGSNGKWLTIRSIELDKEKQTTYNFEVADYHTYFVGVSGAWVHNQCDGDGDDGVPNNGPSVGDLRAAKQKDAHHIVQDAAVRDLPGYNTNAAPGIQLAGGGRGTPHHAANQVQRQSGGGTYAAERRIAYKALRRAGVSRADARREIRRADAYFESIGVGPNTPTRTPGNRR